MILKKFRTECGAMKRIKSNEIPWTQRNVIERKTTSSVILLTLSNRIDKFEKNFRSIGQ